MLNITIALVPSQANQITLFTSAASQHACALRLAARLMLFFSGLERGRTFTLIYAIVLEFLCKRVAHMKQTDRYLKRGFWTDKSLVVVGIKEGTLIKLSDVEEQLEENQKEGLCKTFSLLKVNIMR